MSLFDQLVSEALREESGYAPLRSVVEKELLHHDILREMSGAGILRQLTFIGGTCLRTCYGSSRLSEDLDFTGGKDFERKTLSALGTVLVDTLQTKYNLKVEVSEPIRGTGNVDTWKIKVYTRMERRGMPVQRINIDICALPSYEKKPIILRNHYGVSMGTEGLIIQAQSREEILADKIVAFALRANRMKNRDIWDIGWLKQQNVSLPHQLVEKKIADRKYSSGEFLEILSDRLLQLQEDPGVHRGFLKEMRRFLPPKVVADTVEKEEFWSYLIDLISIECGQVMRWFDSRRGQNDFVM